MVHMCFTLKVLALDNGRWFLHTENLILVQLRLGRVLVAERTAQVLHGLKWLEYIEVLMSQRVESGKALKNRI